MTARWLLVWVLALCLIGAAAGHLLVMRAAAQDASARAGLEHGQRIVQMLEQSGLAAARRDAVLQSYFDQYGLVLLEILDSTGAPVFRRPLAQAEPDRSLAWSTWITGRPATVELAVPARLSSPAASRLRLQAPVADAEQRLSRYSMLFAGVMGLAAACALLVGVVMLRGMRRRAGLAGAASSSTSEGSAASASDSSDSSMTTIFAEPSSQPLTMDQRSARRLRKLAKLEGLLVAQARELDELRHKAQTDAVTGLPNRRDAMARLYAALEAQAAQSGGQLLLLRLRDLAGTNRRVGYEVSDDLLRALAAELRDLAAGDERSICGRLNGSDFMLLRSTGVDADRSDEALLARLRPRMTSLDPQCGVAIGTVQLGDDIDVARAMSLADEALANAEAGPAFSCARIGHTADLVAFGDSVWQQRLTSALECQRTVLAGYPVCARDGRLLYLDCPMHVRFDEQGDHQPATRWLPPAIRARMNPQIDLHVLGLALEAIAEDRQPRCINVATLSLASSDFLVQATRMLEAAGDDASRLWIDLPESVAVEQRALLLEASRRWWPLGVRLALEHAGEQLGHIDALGSLGLDSVRIDSRFVCGLTGPDSEPARRHLQGVVRLVHAAGLSITAEGVRLAGDLAVIWTLGFDAATGPAVLKRGHSISPT